MAIIGPEGHARIHLIATSDGLGPDHTVSGVTAGQVLRIISTSGAKFQSLDDLYIPSGVAEANYLRLDASNDPVTGDLQLDERLAINGAVVANTRLDIKGEGSTDVCLALHAHSTAAEFNGDEARFYNLNSTTDYKTRVINEGIIHGGLVGGQHYPLILKSKADTSIVANIDGVIALVKDDDFSEAATNITEWHTETAGTHTRKAYIDPDGMMVITGQSWGSAAYQSRPNVFEALNTFNGTIDVQEEASPGNPSATYNRIYRSSSNRLVTRNSSGTEFEVQNPTIQNSGVDLAYNSSLNFASGLVAIVGQVDVDFDLLDTMYALSGTTGSVFEDNVFQLIDGAAPTATAQFTLDNITAGQNRIVTLPDADFTPAGLGLTQTFTGTNTFSGLVSIDVNNPSAFSVAHAAGGLEVFSINTGLGGGRGSVGINIAASSSAALDIAGNTGASARFRLTGPFPDAANDSAIKNSRMAMGHYLFAEEDITVFGGASTTTTNPLVFGGGSTIENGATSITFYAHPDNVTLGSATDHIQMHMTSAGVEIGGGNAPSAQGALSITGAGSTSGIIFKGGGVYTAASIYHSASNEISIGAGDSLRVQDDLHIEDQCGIGVDAHATIRLDIIGSTGNVIRLGSSTTDAASKFAQISLRHYTNAEQDIMAMGSQSLITTTNLFWGGGSTALNAATSHTFYTAQTNTTTDGLAAMKIGAATGTTTDYDEGGKVGIGVANALARLHIDTKTTEGTEALRIDQDDADKAFIDFEGTESANLLNNIATGLSAHGGTIKFLRMEIGGAAYWLMASTAPA